jgi:hypothetical protein
MTEKSEYDNYIADLILSDAEYNIKEVRDLESVKFVLFIEEQYKKIQDLIKKQEWKKVNELKDLSAGEFREYLDIKKFKDQDGKQYVTTIYDSDELFQDPQIIDIFPL